MEVAVRACRKSVDSTQSGLIAFCIGFTTYARSAREGSDYTSRRDRTDGVVIRVRNINGAIKGAAYHEHLYTNALAGRETDELEQWLAGEFEDPAEGRSGAPFLEDGYRAATGNA